MYFLALLVTEEDFEWLRFPLGARSVVEQLGDELVPLRGAGCGEIKQPTNDRRFAVLVAHRITTRPVGLNGGPHSVERGLDRRYLVGS